MSRIGSDPKENYFGIRSISLEESPLKGLSDGSGVNDQDIVNLGVKLFRWSSGDDGSHRCQVNSKKVLDLNKDGNSDLVVLAEEDLSPYDPKIIFTACRSGDRWVVQTLPTTFGDIDDTLSDIDGDGSFEIKAKEVLSGGNYAAFFWFDIYAWTPDGFTHQNHRFLESFYIRQYLPYIAGLLSDSAGLLSPDKEKCRIKEPSIAQCIGEDELWACHLALSRIAEMMKAASLALPDDTDAGVKRKIESIMRYGK